MPTNGRTRSRAVEVITALVMFVCAGAGVVGPLAARAVAADSVKYYAVAASFAGKPENLSEIALRFLGDAARSNEIFDLNVGRKQPDGGALSNPDSLHQGWFLILAWDAVGDGVRYGELPTSVPVQTAATPAPQGSTPGSVPANSGSAEGSPPGSCAVAPTSGQRSKIGRAHV